MRASKIIVEVEEEERKDQDEDEVPSFEDDINSQINDDYL